MRTSRLPTLAAALALAAAAPALADPLPHFHAVAIFDDHPDDGTYWTFGPTPNAHGQVAGQLSRLTGNAWVDSSFVTGAQGRGTTTLVDPQGRQVIPFALNDAGRVVGMTQDAQYHTHPFVLSDDGHTIIDLGTFGGDQGAAMAINAHGTIVGNATDAAGNVIAFVTKVGDPVLRPLGGQAGSSLPVAINDAGQVAGDVGSHAFITDAGGRNPREITPGRASAAAGMNAGGQVVGMVTDFRGVSVAMLTGPNGSAPLTFHENFTAGWDSYSQLTTIDDAGHAVGYIYDGRANDSSAAWADIGNLDLVTFDSITTLPAGVHLRDATIDRRGRIVATGSDDKQYRLIPD